MATDQATSHRKYLHLIRTGGGWKRAGAPWLPR